MKATIFATVAALVLAACSSGTGNATGVGGSTAAGGGGGGGGAPSCAEICPAVVQAHCTAGPKTESDCESGCQQLQSGPCTSQYQALLSCAGTHPQITCSPSGSVSVVGCDSQTSALNTCLASQ